MNNIWVERNEKLMNLLDVILASENILNLKVRKYHWNVESKRFRGLHMYFEELYNASNDRIDEVAERIRILGDYTKWTFKEYLELSLVKEDTAENVTDMQMLENISNDKVTILKTLREAVSLAWDLWDIWTEGLLSGFVEVYEKDLWMLRSTIK